MAVSEDAGAGLAAKFAVMRPHLGERQWRLYLGSEARALGHGGIAAVARAAGVSEMLVAAGVSELEAGAEPMPGRQRRAGGGRKRLEDKDPDLRAALRGLAEAATRGDPMAEVTWCSLSLRELERQMAALGFWCGKDAIARMLRAGGYSLQAMAKVLEGKQHPGRDDQFRHVNAMIAQFKEAGEPAVSVDGKKKEQLGPYHRAGRSWRPAGDPVRVRDHDFPDAELGKITPYGVYDIAANTGFVSVGTSHDTAAFAVNALRLWWQREGSVRYPAARRLLVVCDAGGSNSCTGAALERPAGRPGGRDGAGDHRLPLPARHVQVEQDRAPAVLPHHPHLAGPAAHDQRGRRGRHRRHHHLPGPEVHRRPRRRHLPGKGQNQRSADEVPGRTRHRPARHARRVELHHPARGRRAGTGAAGRPAPGPDLEGLAALADVGDLGALLAAVTVPWQAAREQRLHLDRGAARRKASGGTPWRLPFAAIVTAAACHQRLRMPYRLPGELLGAHESTISLAARRVIPLLEAHGITPDDGGTRVATLAELREHAATAGITLTTAATGQPAADHAKRRSPQTQHAQS